MSNSIRCFHKYIDDIPLYFKFKKNIYFAENLFSRLALDFPPFLKSMRMSSWLLKILEISEMNIYKSNTRII